MNYSTESPSIILLLPDDTQVVTPRKRSTKTCYYDIPNNAMVLDLKRSLPDKRASEINLVVRYKADLSKLEEMLEIAQYHNVYITSYTVEAIKMLRKVSDFCNVYNEVKRELDEKDELEIEEQV